jgi:type I restriction-modification system DNA methylase subunit
MAQLEHTGAIEKRLWTAADTLRANSSYASSKYFLPVMGLVFLQPKAQVAGQKPHDGGEFFTPVSLVSLIAHVVEPERAPDI